MKVYTPQISWHNRTSLLSVDIQNRPYGGDASCPEDAVQVQRMYRLATGGYDARVNIFRVAFQSSQGSSEQPKCKSNRPLIIDCLAELTSHQRSVNIVRFSPNLEDNYLAAGDDDSLIFIWKLFEEKKDDGSSTKEASSTADNKSENNENNNSLNNSLNNSTNSGGNMLEDTIAEEIWKPYKILRGHNQDVSDLCWSADGKKLVSGSVDNNVFVWDIARGTKLHKVVKEHQSYVQGVVWDPLNRYIASLSADRSMLVFNVNTGRTVHRVYKLTSGEKDKDKDKEEKKDENELFVIFRLNTTETAPENVLLSKKTSSKLFFDQTLESFCRRLTFSPGGELLFAPSGIFEGGCGDEFKNTVYVFERKDLSRPAFYLPTNKASVAVSCCPVVFELKSGVEENALNYPYRIVFAVLTQDSVLLYDSQQLTPFAFVSQVHYFRLTDLSWAPDGSFLLITSTDGFASFIHFNEEAELGTPYTGPLLSLEDMNMK